ncbi:MAG: tetratricopeptide repeat protein, partial [Caulobacteraceae bacterium]
PEQGGVFLIVVDFIEEVEEQLRSDRYAGFARRALPWFALALAAVVAVWLGVWGYDNWRNRNVAQASVTYDKGLSAVASGDAAGAWTALEPIAKSGPPAYRGLALMQEGNLRAMAGKSAEAAALYDAAAKAAPNAIFRDAARLKAALILIDTTPYPQIQTRLGALIGDKKPFDLQAREGLAMARLLAGKAAQARGDFNAITLTIGVTPAMRSRAQAAIALIDAGEGGVLSAAVATAATLPPPSAATLALPPGAPATEDQSNPQAAAPDAPAPAAP